MHLEIYFSTLGMILFGNSLLSLLQRSFTHENEKMNGEIR